jgi:uncharacterized protein YabN with tetrapyrrole methylase and pyrophosphatase domain
MMRQDNLIEDVGDVVFATIAIATVLKWLPPTATALTIVWMGMRIFDWIEARFSKKEKKSADRQDS